MITTNLEKAQEGLGNINTDKELSNIVNMIEVFYGAQRDFVPSLGTSAFASFCGASSHLTSQLYDDKDFTIVMNPSIHTARMNFVTKKVELPAVAASSEYYETVFGISPKTSGLSLIAMSYLLGSQVHEIAHVVNTPSNLYDNAWGRLEKFGYDKQFVYNLVNILEDYRIEHVILKRGKNDVYAKLLKQNKSITFSKEIAEKVFKADSENPTPQTRSDVILLGKRPNFRAIICQYFNNLDGLWEALAPNTYEPYSSIEKAEWFLTNLFDFPTSEEEEEGEGGEPEEEEEGEESQSGSDSGSEKAEEESEKPENESEKSKSGEEKEVSPQEHSQEVEEELEELLEELEEILEEIASEFDDSLEEEKAEKKSEAAEEFFSTTGEKTKTKSVFSPNVKHYEMAPTFKEPRLNGSFLRKLREVRSINVAYGEIRTTGQKLVKTRLHRIGVDGKMFARNVAQETKQTTVEVIFLVDFSGSMHSMIKDVVAKTFSICQELKKVGIGFKVYGHTTSNMTVASSYRPYVFFITDNNRKMKDDFRRALSIPMNDNWDGVAIEKVAEEFSPNADVKILYVMSDGRPAGRGYDGQEHTKSIIKKVRSQIDALFSISLVPYVVRYNSHLYGEKFNIDASDLGKMKNEFAKKFFKFLETRKGGRL